LRRLDALISAFQAPDSELVAKEMEKFVDWFNHKIDIDPVLKAAIAHLWFVTIHPFEDGNGRNARAITDLQLARADNSEQRFYSISSQIRLERNTYYNILEKTQKGNMDISDWLIWFLSCFERSLSNTDQTLGSVIQKAKFWDNPKLNGINSRQHFMLNKLLDNFEGKLTSSKWAKMAKCSQDTASRDIQDLVTRAILTKDEAGGRSTSYLLLATE
jgi:Fic family protein